MLRHEVGDPIAFHDQLSTQTPASVSSVKWNCTTWADRLLLDACFTTTTFQRWLVNVSIINDHVTFIRLLSTIGVPLIARPVSKDVRFGKIIPSDKISRLLYISPRSAINFYRGASSSSLSIDNFLFHRYSISTTTQYQVGMHSKDRVFILHQTLDRGISFSFTSC